MKDKENGMKCMNNDHELKRKEQTWKQNTKQ